MKSPITDKDMVIMQTPSDIRYKGEWVTYMHSYWLCEESGEQFTTTEMDESNTWRIKFEYEHLTTKKNSNEEK